MKNKLIYFIRILGILTLLGVTPSIVFVGCQTSSQLRAAQTILSVQSGVDNLMSNYAKAIELGSVSLEDRVKVRDIYREYEKAENAAIMGLEVSDLEFTDSPEELSQAAFDLTILILNLLDK